MSTFADIKKTIADLPISDILRARLDFAFDQSAALERQVGELQIKVGQLQAQLEAAILERDNAQRELYRLQAEHGEEIRILYQIEFRRGKRTGGKWDSFCPKCHLPAVETTGNLVNDVYCSGRCGWLVSSRRGLRQMISELEKGG
jgi:hypothetical protein